MDGYFVKNNNESGTLRIKMTNLNEFKELIDRAQKEADQLQKTIDQLKYFEIKVDFENG